MNIQTYRARFIAENKTWCERLGYLPEHFEVKATKRGKQLHIVAHVDGDWVHEITIPARGMHPDMREAIAASFAAAIGSGGDSDDTEQRRSA